MTASRCTPGVLARSTDSIFATPDVVDAGGNIDWADADDAGRAASGGPWSLLAEQRGQEVKDALDGDLGKASEHDG